MAGGLRQKQREEAAELRVLTDLKPPPWGPGEEGGGRVLGAKAGGGDTLVVCSGCAVHPHSRCLPRFLMHLGYPLPQCAASSVRGHSFWSLLPVGPAFLKQRQKLGPQILSQHRGRAPLPEAWHSSPNTWVNKLSHLVPKSIID